MLFFTQGLVRTARQYDPSLGRFLQRDPLGYYDHMNLYNYVRNSPNNYIDPYGLAPFGPESPAHTHRNINNKCPRRAPKKGSGSNGGQDSGDGQGSGSSNDTCSEGGSGEGDYKDHEGNKWDEDNSPGNFHGKKEDGFQTFRGTGDLKGSQCTYFNGYLLDSGPYMGTYDYMSPDSPWTVPGHYDHDVAPHNENPHYEPFLTEQY